MKTNILLIDSDLGFVFWLGQALDSAGFEAFPARSIPDAIQLIEQLDLSIDLALVNFALAGAADFVIDLHRRGRTKIIGIIDPRTAVHLTADWHWSKPEASDELAKMEFLLQIHQLLGMALDERADVSLSLRRTIV